MKPLQPYDAGTIIPIFYMKKTEAWRSQRWLGEDQRFTPQAMSSILSSPSLGPSWMDTHLLEALTSTLATLHLHLLGIHSAHSLLAPSSLKRCNIFTRLGRQCSMQGMAAHQVRPKPKEHWWPSQGAEPFWATSPPLFLPRRKMRPREENEQGFS